MAGAPWEQHNAPYEFENVVHRESRGSESHSFGDRLSGHVVTLEADLHGVHLRPRQTAPAQIARFGEFVLDARDRVRGDDHCVPLLDHAVAPDPYRVLRVNRCQWIERPLSPIGGAPCGEQGSGDECTAHYPDEDARHRGLWK